MVYGMFIVVLKTMKKYVKEMYYISLFYYFKIYVVRNPVGLVNQGLTGFFLNNKYDKKSLFIINKVSFVHILFLLQIL